MQPSTSPWPRGVDGSFLYGGTGAAYWRNLRASADDERESCGRLEMDIAMVQERQSPRNEADHFQAR